jgi:hypothetical protein
MSDLSGRKAPAVIATDVHPLRAQRSHPGIYDCGLVFALGRIANRADSLYEGIKAEDFTTIALCD